MFFKLLLYLGNGLVRLILKVLSFFGFSPHNTSVEALISILSIFCVLGFTPGTSSKINASGQSFLIFLLVFSCHSRLL